jgi:hypothetical protein
VSRTLKNLLLVVALLGRTALAGAWWLGIGHNSVISNTARWAVWSRQYKAQVLARPPSTAGPLKHIEWDGWGWAGQDTTVYLVFDPTDALYPAASGHHPGKYKGLPCEVFLVRRLESHWYTVQFYTDEWWGRHNDLNCTGSD